MSYRTGFVTVISGLLLLSGCGIKSGNHGQRYEVVRLHFDGFSKSKSGAT